MKRLIIGLTSGLLMFLGLTAVSGEAANAVCPYTGCVNTSTRVWVPNAPVARHSSAKICVSVRTAGNGTPTGRVGIAVSRVHGGYSLADSKTYRGGKTCFKTAKLNRPGRYVVRANYQAGGRTPFGDSSNTTAFNVKRR